MLHLDPAVHHGEPIPSERRLWLAVLRRAVFDLLGINTYAQGVYRSTLRHFTRLWIESDSREPGSFLWICDQLEFDAGWLRRRLIEMAGKKGQVRTMNPGPAEVALTAYQEVLGEVTEGWKPSRLEIGWRSVSVLADLKNT